MYENDSVVQRKAGFAIETNQVLRRTYGLLSLTLIFSAIMAYVSMTMHVPQGAATLCLIAGFVMLFVTMAMRRSVAGIFCVFLFTGLLGFSLGPMLNAYISTFSNGPQLVMTALGATGVIFLSLSAYVLTTRKDFSYLGGFLTIALIVVILASLAGLFFPMPMLQIVISAAAVLIFSGFILYDTSRIINGGERNFIMATISLYLDIFNLFINLLQLLAAFSGRD